MNDVVIASAARTAIGSYGKSLSGVPPSELGAIATVAALERAGIEAAEVEHVVFGNVIHTEPGDMYMGRVVGMKAGIPQEVPAYTVNRLCGTGVQAIVSAAQAIQTGEANVAVAGGAESMSRGPYWMPSARWGARMGEAELVDPVMGGLTDPFHSILMGVTAENLAQRNSISRERQDEFALESHRRAAAARAEGRFTAQIVPVPVRVKRETVEFAADEHIRADATAESMAKLKPVFRPDGSVTAGNASGMNDAGAAVVLMSAARAQELGAPVRARVLAYASCGVDPEIMGIGPVPAVRKVLERSGVSLDDVQLIELNEAFAAQALAVIDELGLDEERVNPNGGAIALGHPIAATGAAITAKLLDEMERRDLELGLVTLCIGGGQGIALLLGRE
ncbi:MAG: acetyl-CoA C-acetyltransferase [Solirubrobacteraceae bacterium]|jgi:acetyl-CoA C-acetyltransferase|nr:acetyl-CoA C-acetyltransferase [Solirubrobacteraceae bacterium]